MIKWRRIIEEGHIVSMGRRGVYTGFWWGNKREGDHLVDPGLVVNILLKWIFTKSVGARIGFDLSQYKYRWRALFNAVMNLRFQ